MRLFNDPRPENFPLRSPASRAAAKELREKRAEPTISVQIICVGRQDGDPPLPAPQHCGDVLISYVGAD